MKDKFIKTFADVLKKVFDKQQTEPNQYIVGVYNIHTNELLGYHASTFCQKTNDPLQAKRYNGENPYPQLEIIANNMKHNFSSYPASEDVFFYSTINSVVESYEGLKMEDLYIDAVYLAEGIPTQKFKCTII